ncbi:MAG: hypothetical protein MI725_02195 [Pirellulales bacterium]|nr:hypothetical protein [Pirellulales bacterium]
MALATQDRERLQQLGREVREILGGSTRDDGSPKSFDEMEDDSIEAADIIGTAMLESNVQEGQEPAGACRCPSCHRMSPRREDAEPRVLQTDRGEVTWLEVEYFCRRCRRSFFPSHGKLGVACGSDGECAGRA